MTENTTTVSDTTSSRGAQWAGAGSLIALAAQSLLGGGIGNILGGGASSTAAQAANTAVAIELTKKDCEIALLKSGKETDQKLVDVYTELRSQDKSQDAKVASIDQRLAALETAAPLREQIVMGKINETATLASNGIAANSTAINNLAAVVNSVVTPVVKNTSVCPGWGTVTITPQGSFPFPFPPPPGPTPA